MRTINIVLLNIIIVLTGSVFTTSAQTGKLVLKGEILDASNNKPVEFANIGVVGTFLGTASDIDGVFNLSIDKEYSDFDVVISAVGYQSKKVKVSELTGGKVVIKMTPAVYGLSQVDIKARSKVLYGIIRSAGNLIPHNYVSSPLYYSVFYVKDNDHKKTEAVISLIDNKGYESRSEAIRDLIRRALVERQWEEGKEQTVGTLTVVYDHEEREISRKIVHAGHEDPILVLE